MTGIAAVLGRPLWPLRVPAKLLGAVLGELAELFVAGQRVVPGRALALGFAFRHATIDAALTNLFARRRAADEPPPRVRSVNDSR
jgi:hypothetical protein